MPVCDQSGSPAPCPPKVGSVLRHNNGHGSSHHVQPSRQAAAAEIASLSSQLETLRAECGAAIAKAAEQTSQVEWLESALNEAQIAAKVSGPLWECSGWAVCAVGVVRKGLEVPNRQYAGTMKSQGSPAAIRFRCQS